MDEQQRQTSGQTARGKRPGRWRPFVLVGVILAVVVLSVVFRIDRKLVPLRDWIRGFGVWGPVIFIPIYIAATVIAVPGSVLTVGAGGFMGWWVALISVSIASTIGAALCFLIARYFARASLERSFAANEKFRKLDRLTKDHGPVIVAITRLIPLFPFNLLNYGFGLTGVSFWTYVFWSWLCMLPGTLLYVAVPDAIAELIAEGKVSPVLLVVIAADIVILVFVTLYARRRLERKRTPEEETAGE